MTDLFYFFLGIFSALALGYTLGCRYQYKRDREAIRGAAVLIHEDCARAVWQAMQWEQR